MEISSLCICVSSIPITCSAIFLLQSPCDLLTHFEICTCIDVVNDQVIEEHQSKSPVTLYCINIYVKYQDTH